MIEKGASQQRVEILDPLRFVAAMAVVSYHYSFRGAAADSLSVVSLPDISYITKYGYLGVQMFFMISGFIIAHSAYNRASTDFVIARLIRIYPGFLACMTITCVALLLITPQFRIPLDQWAANIIIYAPALGYEYVDGVYWTLVIEITFYAWVAIFMSLGLFERYGMAIALVWLTGSLVNQLLIGSWRIDQIFLTSYSGFFAVGLAIHKLYSQKCSRLGIIVLMYALAVAVFQAVQPIPNFEAHYGQRFSLWVVSGVIVGSSALILSVLAIRRLPISPGFLIAVGGLTYPLYLLHQVIGYAVFNRLGSLVPAWPLVIMVTTGIVALSYVVWRWVEQPMQKALKVATARFVRAGRVRAP
jgi:peptidoglycan/LPS O-acetylase OafA/YrhL